MATLDELVQSLDAGGGFARQIRSMMIGRELTLFDAADPQHEVFAEAVRGVATEVGSVTGYALEPGPYRDLAVRTIATGVAAQLESSLFPEQNGLGDSATVAGRLQARFLALLERLGSDDQAAGVTDTSPRPRGNFPPASPYPDPAYGGFGRLGW